MFSGVRFLMFMFVVVSLMHTPGYVHTYICMYVCPHNRTFIYFFLLITLLASLPLDNNGVCNKVCFYFAVVCVCCYFFIYTNSCVFVFIFMYEEMSYSVLYM